MHLGLCAHLSRERATVLGCSVATMFSEELAYEVNESGGDVAERGVDSARQGLHACGSAESDQGNHHCILNQVLTFLAVLQFLELHIKLQKHVVHFVLSGV